jgi:outer membrane immunogenic protein
MLQKVWSIGAASAIALSVLAGNVAHAQTAGPIFNWSGFYAGVNAGYGWGDRTGDLVEMQGLAGAAIGSIPFSYDTKADGLFGGVQLGYNAQSGAVLFGFEADLQAGAVGDSKTLIFIDGLGLTQSISTMQHELPWFGTVRARLGFTPTDRALYYVTGGFAYGRVKSESRICFPLGSTCDGDFRGSVDRIKTGWTVGGGAEYALGNNWSLKAEYLYVDLGSDTVLMTDPLFPADSLSYRFDHQDHIVRLGLNYTFAPR